MLCRTLEGHAHWVNTLALSTDYILRTEAVFSTQDKMNASDSKLKQSVFENMYN